MISDFDLPETGRAPNHEKLRLALELNHFPGGQYALPHYENGPFHLVVISLLRHPDRVTSAVLEAYPALYQLPLVELENVRRVTVHAVPEYVHDVLRFTAADGWFEIDHDQAHAQQRGPFEQLPGDEQILALLSYLVSDPMLDLDRPADWVPRSEAALAFTRAAAQGGPRAVINLVRQLPDEVLTDQSALATAVDGVFDPPG